MQVIPKMVFPHKVVVQEEPGMIIPVAQEQQEESCSIDEARLYDLFFPVNRQQIKLCFEDEQKCVVSFQCEVNKEDIYALYRSGMESLGWNEVALFPTEQSCLLFEKPSRICSVIINQDSQTLLQKITIYRGTKRATDYT